MSIRNWGSPIKHAAWLVNCPDDAPEDVVAVRCEAANTIKKLWDENKRLQAKLTQTKDGVWVGPGDIVWNMEPDGIMAKRNIWWTHWSLYQAGWGIQGPEVSVDTCYSTHEAAKKVEG